MSISELYAASSLYVLAHIRIISGEVVFGEKKLRLFKLVKHDSIYTLCIYSNIMLVLVYSNEDKKMIIFGV